jgi:acetyl-CoA C-acetyltransferase
MVDVVIAGVGQVPVGEHWDLSLHTLSTRAIRAALQDSGGLEPQALYIGNFLGSVLTRQTNLGALLSGHAGLKGVESYTLEAAGASGAAALRMGFLAISSGYVDVAVVVGVEKFTDGIGPQVEAAVALASDTDYEGEAGMTPTAQAAMLANRYIHEYKMPREALADFTLLAHANGAGNPNAFYRRALKPGSYARAEMVANPLNIFDIAPQVDGAAAVVLARADLAKAKAGHPQLRISGSASAIDTLALHDRPDPLGFQAARVSVERACRQAGILPKDADLFELSDNYSIYAVLSLEAAGFAARGEGWKLAQSGGLSLTGKLPIVTMGGCKARGDPLAATGVYQAVEAAQQLRGDAGKNQLPNPRRALIQSLGGPASTAITHVLERLDGS